MGKFTDRLRDFAEHLEPVADYDVERVDVKNAAVIIDELEEALRPFAATAGVDIGSTETDEDTFQPLHHNRAPTITVGDFRRALSALSKLESLSNEEISHDEA